MCVFTCVFTCVCAQVEFYLSCPGPSTGEWVKPDSWHVEQNPGAESRSGGLGYRLTTPSPGAPRLPALQEPACTFSRPFLPRSWPGNCGPMTQPAGAGLQLQLTQAGGQPLAPGPPGPRAHTQDRAAPPPLLAPAARTGFPELALQRLEAGWRLGGGALGWGPRPWNLDPASFLAPGRVSWGRRRGAGPSTGAGAPFLEPAFLGKPQGFPPL